VYFGNPALTYFAAFRSNHKFTLSFSPGYGNFLGYAVKETRTLSDPFFALVLKSRDKKNRVKCSQLPAAARCWLRYADDFILVLFFSQEKP